MFYAIYAKLYLRNPQRSRYLGWFRTCSKFDCCYFLRLVPTQQHNVNFQLYQQEEDGGGGGDREICLHWTLKITRLGLVGQGGVRAKWRWCPREVGWCPASGYLFQKDASSMLPRLDSILELTTTSARKVSAIK